MTKEEIIGNTRDELADNGITYYSTADLEDSFDDGYLEVSIATNVIERLDTVALVDNLVYYDLYENIPNFLRVFAIWNPDISNWMSHKNLDHFRRQRHDWEKAHGSSYKYSVIDFQYIALFPHKLTADDTELEVFHNAVPTTPMSKWESPEIPEQYQVVLQYYQMFDLLAQAEEFTKAETYFQKYISKRDELKHYVNNRSMPDRIHMLREQFSGGSFYGE